MAVAFGLTWSVASTFPVTNRSPPGVPRGGFFASYSVHPLLPFCGSGSFPSGKFVDDGLVDSIELPVFWERTENRSGPGFIRRLRGVHPVAEPPFLRSDSGEKPFGGVQVLDFRVGQFPLVRPMPRMLAPRLFDEKVFLTVGFPGSGQCRGCVHVHKCRCGAIPSAPQKIPATQVNNASGRIQNGDSAKSLLTV